MIRSSYGQHVVWEYENGGTREFALGENVAVQYPDGYLAGLVTYVVGQRVAFTDPATRLVTAGFVDQVLGADDGIYLIGFYGDWSVAAFACELEPVDMVAPVG